MRSWRTTISKVAYPAVQALVDQGLTEPKKKILESSLYDPISRPLHQASK